MTEETKQVERTFSVSIALPPSLAQKAADVAAERGVSRSEFVRGLIQREIQQPAIGQQRGGDE